MDMLLYFVLFGIIFSPIECQEIVAVYVGCYNDNNRYRTLGGPDRKFHQNGIHNCAHYCSQLGYRYAGTEYANECYCGNEIGRDEQTCYCNYSCKNNPGETCGGSNCISIYDIGQCATKQPCLNGGTCYDYNANNYWCTCPEQWTGKNCNIAIITTTTTSTTPTTTTTTPPPTTTTTPSTAKIIPKDTTETMLETSSILNATHAFDKMPITDTDDEAVVIIYTSVACAVVIVVIVVLIILCICWRRRKVTASKDKAIVNPNSETTSRAANGVERNVSVISIDPPSRTTTLYSNDHVIMTAEGEHVNIEFHVAEKHDAVDATDDFNDYNTLTSSGRGVNSGIGSNKRHWKRRANDVENTYSHLSEQETDSDTYSRTTRSRQNKISRVCDSTYSHIGHGASFERSSSPSGAYNTLTLSKSRDRNQKQPDNGLIKERDENDCYNNVNIFKSDQRLEISIDEDDYSHVVKSEICKTDSEKDLIKHEIVSNDKDDLYAKVEKSKPSIKTKSQENPDEKQKSEPRKKARKPKSNSRKNINEEHKPRYTVSEESDQESDYYNVGNDYYNVCFTKST